MVWFSCYLQEAPGAWKSDLVEFLIPRLRTSSLSPFYRYGRQGSKLHVESMAENPALLHLGWNTFHPCILLRILATRSRSQDEVIPISSPIGKCGGRSKLGQGERRPHGPRV